MARAAFRPSGSVASFARLGHILRHCGHRALLVGTATSILALVVCWLALPPQPPTVTAVLRFSAVDEGAAIELRGLLASLVRDKEILDRALNQPGSSDLAILRTQKTPTQWLASVLQVAAPPAGDTISVSLKGDRAEDRAALVNAVAEAAAAEMSRRDRIAAENRYHLAQDESNRAREALSTARGKWRALVGPEGDALRRAEKVLRDRTEETERQLTQARSERAEKDAELAALRLREKSPTAPLPPGLEEYITANAEMKLLLSARSNAQAEVARWEGLAEPGEVPRQLREAREAREKNEEQISDLRARLRQRFVAERTPGGSAGSAALLRLERETEILGERLVRGESELHWLGDESKRLAARVADAERCREEVAASEAALRRAEAEVQVCDEALKARPRVTLATRADAPFSPFLYRVLSSLFAWSCGIVVVLGGYMIREWGVRHIFSPADLAGSCGLRVLGTLPRARSTVRSRLVGVGPTPGDAGHRLLSEAADAVRTQLMYEADRLGLRVILVTSGDKQEGKSALASQLAISLARAWRRTLLIDGDLRRPAAHRIFNLPAEPGFSEVLRGEADLESVTHATPVSRLWAVTAGHLDDHALQALAQEGLGKLLETAKAQYDFVIVDAPPVLPVADALMMAQHVDGVLLSVLLGTSRLPLLDAARSRLQSVGAKVLGAVIADDPGETVVSEYARKEAVP
jgi:capsular exopolysaccharide synthesis family protein